MLDIFTGTLYILLFSDATKLLQTDDSLNITVGNTFDIMCGNLKRALDSCLD